LAKRIATETVVIDLTQHAILLQQENIKLYGAEKSHHLNNVYAHLCKAIKSSHEFSLSGHGGAMEEPALPNAGMLQITTNSSVFGIQFESGLCMLLQMMFDHDWNFTHRLQNSTVHLAHVEPFDGLIELFEDPDEYSFDDDDPEEGAKTKKNNLRQDGVPLEFKCPSKGLSFEKGQVGVLVVMEKGGDESDGSKYSVENKLYATLSLHRTLSKRKMYYWFFCIFFYWIV